MANQKLNIVITAFDKTKSAFRGISAGVGAVTSAVFSLKTALVGVVGAAGIGLLVRNSLQATDALSKTAQKLGVTTESLSALRYAAELSGVGIQTTDMAVQRFTRRLAEAAQGTGEAKGALRELNIDAAQLSKLPLQEQMFALADAFGNVKNANDEVRLGFKLFDSEGLAFINTLKEGRDGLQAMFQEAETLGVVMSASAAKGVEDANDALTKLASLFKGITDQVVAALAPAIEEFATSLKDTVVVSIKDANENIKLFAQSLAKGLLQSLANTLRAFADFIEGVQGFINILVDAANAIQRFRGQTEFAYVNLGLLTDGARDAAKTVDNLAESIGKATEAVKSQGGNLPNEISLLEQLGLAFNKASQQATTLQDALDQGVKRALDSTTNTLADIVVGANSAKDAFKNMARSILADMAKMFIRQQITQPLFTAIGSAFAPASTGTTAVPSGNGGGFTGLGARAGGIDGKGGFPAILHPNETVIDHTKGQGMGGAVSVTLNISTGVSQTVRAEIANLMPQITEATKGAVLEARQRGGSYSRGLAGI